MDARSEINIDELLRTLIDIPSSMNAFVDEEDRTIEDVVTCTLLGEIMDAVFIDEVTRVHEGRRRCPDDGHRNRDRRDKGRRKVGHVC
ncbi:unnamed protein product [Macrosiphum euphorbiae]|uniref:Uncharacterized protein n=1 Tax=Macrosiphum euphorbiae TaxID=13131 RepID=A0AAV0W4X7_9HEMI|nr:unnamed protein product [Macrosiphum euphorbiae]